MSVATSKDLKGMTSESALAEKQEQGYPGKATDAFVIVWTSRKEKAVALVQPAARVVFSLLAAIAAYAAVGGLSGALGVSHGALNGYFIPIGIGAFVAAVFVIVGIMAIAASEYCQYRIDQYHERVR